jgi:hypothetical protein
MREMGSNGACMLKAMIFYFDKERVMIPCHLYRSCFIIVLASAWSQLAIVIIFHISDPLQRSSRATVP